MKSPRKKLWKILLEVLIVIFFVAGTAAIYFISKGYQFNVNDGEIEKTGILEFTTFPKRVYITIDDEYEGKSPRSVPGIKEGIHKVKLSQDGYYDWTSDIEVLAEQSIPITATLFLKSPEEEVIFPTEDQEKDTEIDQLFFDEEQTTAIFTVIRPPDQEIEDSAETLEIWNYRINRRFWEFQDSINKIAEIPYFLETSQYEIKISADAQNILLNVTENDTPHFYILDGDTKNNDPQEITDLAKYSPSPMWSKDSQHLIYQVNGELRSFNIDSNSQSILAEKDNDDPFVWTSDQDGNTYIIEETDLGFTVTKVQTSGENKAVVIENISKRVPEDSQTTEDNSETNTDNDQDTDSPNTKNTDTEVSAEEINEIHVTSDDRHLILMTTKSIIVYSFDQKDLEQTPAQNPQFISLTEEDDKFLYFDNDKRKLMEYILQIEEGDPAHTLGSRLLTELDTKATYTGFSWYPEGTNIIFSKTKVNSSSDNTDNEDTIKITVQAIHNDSQQLFNIYKNADSNRIALGNSGKYFVTTCPNNTLCKVTIHH